MEFSTNVYIIGYTKNVTNGFTYTFVSTSFFAMHGIAEWKKFQIKNTSASYVKSTVSDVFRKTGKKTNLESSMLSELCDL